MCIYIYVCVCIVCVCALCVCVRAHHACTFAHVPSLTPSCVEIGPANRTKVRTADAFSGSYCIGYEDSKGGWPPAMQGMRKF